MPFHKTSTSLSNQTDVHKITLKQYNVKLCRILEKENVQISSGTATHVSFIIYYFSLDCKQIEYFRSTFLWLLAYQISFVLCCQGEHGTPLCCITAQWECNLLKEPVETGGWLESRYVFCNYENHYQVQLFQKTHNFKVWDWGYVTTPWLMTLVENP